MYEKCVKGFTLIETLIILSIVLILSVAAIPTMRGLVQKYRISGVAENLYYALQNARSEAVKRNTNVYVSFSTGDNWCYGIKVGSNCDCTVANSCTSGTYSAESPGLISLSDTFVSNYVYFEATHGGANSNGSVTLTLYGQSPLITINIGTLGNLQMCSTGISGYTAC